MKMKNLLKWKWKITEMKMKIYWNENENLLKLHFFVNSLKLQWKFCKITGIAMKTS